MIAQSLEQDRMKEEYLARQQQQQQQQHHNDYHQMPQHHHYPLPPPPPPPPQPQESDSSSSSSNMQSNEEATQHPQKQINEKEEIFKLNCKLNEYEKQNSQLKQDTDRLNRRCAQLSMSEVQTTHELSNLKLKIQQMLDQYAELDRKFNENLSKLKLYEQRYVASF